MAVFSSGQPPGTNPVRRSRKFRTICLRRSTVFGICSVPSKRVSIAIFQAWSKASPASSCLLLQVIGWHNFPMCGRYKLSRRKQVVEEYFDGTSDEPDWAPRYNIAPTQPIPVIRQNPKEPVRE